MYAPQRPSIRPRSEHRYPDHPYVEQLSLFGPSVAVPRSEPPDVLGGALAIALICIPWLLIGWLLWMVF